MYWLVLLCICCLGIFVDCHRYANTNQNLNSFPILRLNGILSKNQKFIVEKFFNILQSLLQFIQLSAVIKKQGQWYYVVGQFNLFWKRTIALAPQHRKIRPCIIERRDVFLSLGLTLTCINAKKDGICCLKIFKIKSPWSGAVF